MFESGNTLLHESLQGTPLTLNDGLGPSTERAVHSTTSLHKRKFYIESYGCQMNFSDSEIVASILQTEGYELIQDPKVADVILLNTCSIRENAELKIRMRLRELKGYQSRKPGSLIGILGCMAERLKSKLLEEERLVDMVVGPDAYRDLPKLMAEVASGHKSVNVLLSREETYGDLSPLRFASNGISAFVSIMRGCDNMCSFCVVPFTRGRERSRDSMSILREVESLVELGYKEVTLLGQNVDSYQFAESGRTLDFADLLKEVAGIDSTMRIRFSTSHPKDITNKVIERMAQHKNICKNIHLPIQSGSSRILALMNRTYNRDWYLERIQAIRQILPDCGISSDLMVGFCSETEQDHRDTLSLVDQVQFDYAFMFKYSERPGTLAAKKYPDDVPEEVKSSRLQELIEVQRAHSFDRLKRQIGTKQHVLVEGFSKKSDQAYCGRTDKNSMVVFPVKSGVHPGACAEVLIDSCTSATLIGRGQD